MPFNSPIVVTLHYVSCYCYGYYHHTTCDSCVYWCTDCYYDCCNYFLFSRNTWNSRFSGCIATATTIMAMRILLALLLHHSNNLSGGCTGQHACYHSGLCQLYHGSSKGEFFTLRADIPTYMLCWCFGFYFLLSGSDAVSFNPNEGLILLFASQQLFRA